MPEEDKPFIELVPVKGSILTCKQQVIAHSNEFVDIPNGCTKLRIVEEYCPEEDEYFLNVLFFVDHQEEDEEFEARLNSFHERRKEALNQFRAKWSIFTEHEEST